MARGGSEFIVIYSANVSMIKGNRPMLLNLDNFPCIACFNFMLH